MTATDTDKYTLVFTDGERITVATEAEAEALSAQHADRNHVTLLPNTDEEDTYIPPVNPSIAAALRDAEIGEARWWLTGMGYSERDAAAMVGLMITAEVDITKHAALTEWMRDNQADWPRY